MERIKRIFNITSCLQYPLMVAGISFIYRPIILRLKEQQLTDFNTGLILVGLTISFSSLQEGRKAQNKIAKTLLRNPKYTRYFLTHMAVMIALSLCFAVFAYFITDNAEIKELSTGLFVLSIGFLGLSRMIIEMSEYQTSVSRRDD